MELKDTLLLVVCIGDPGSIAQKRKNWRLFVFLLEERVTTTIALLQTIDSCERMSSLMASMNFSTCSDKRY
jgi:hypothetical protein